MELLTLTLLIIAFAWFVYYCKRTLNYFEDRGIPYLPGWPLLGNFWEPMLRRKHITKVIQDMYNVNSEAKYVGAFDFMNPVIVLRDLELIKTITIKNFDDFPDHKTNIDDSLDPMMGGNLFNMAGQRWKESRTMLSPAFTSSKMKMMFEPMVFCAKNFVKYLAELPEEEMKLIATKDVFTKFTNDVIANCAFGVTVDSLKDPNNEFYVLGKKATNLDSILFAKFLAARAVPGLMKLFNIKLVDKQVADFFTNIVRETVAMRDEKGISRPDMLQLMMDARSNESKILKHNIAEMTAQAFIFWFGGFETTSTLMCLLAHELAINPDIQKKLQDEIDEVLSETKGEPTYETINSMLYLDAVFNESLRQHSQMGLLERLCRTAYELPPALPGGKPYMVQPGTSLWIPAEGIHKDPKYYENPDKFDPDRYYHKKVTINDAHNLGFGIGPRSCIGNRFAILEIKVLFFFLLSKYTLKRNEKTCSPLMYDKKKFALVPEGGFSLAIEKRT